MRFYLVLFYILLCINTFGQDKISMAESFYVNNDFSQAKKCLEEILKATPENQKAQILLGKVYGHLNQWELSVAQFQELKKREPKLADAHYLYGGALAMYAKNTSKFKALGKLSEIEEAFKNTLQLNPNHIEAHWALIMYYTELPGIVGGSLQKAKNYAKALHEISPVDSNLAYGYIYEYDQDYKLAEKYYMQAHKIGNSKTTFQKLYNLYLNKLKNTKKANELIQNFNTK